MLLELSLSDFGLADRLSFQPSPGLSAITGETGAGKSLLVNALSFVTGARSVPEYVRSGAALCEVSAVFEATSDSHGEWLEPGDTTLVLRRELSASGRSRGWINDRPVPVSALRRASVTLCDVHGQNQHQALQEGAIQARFLDSFVTGDIHEEYARAFGAWTRCRAELEAHRRRLEDGLKQKDFWEFQRSELERINPRAGEYEELEAQRSRLVASQARQQVESLLEAELTDVDLGLVPRLERLVTRLRAHGGAESLAGTLEAALSSLHEAEQSLARREPELADDLEAVERRLHALYGLKKKFGGSLEAALSERETLSDNLRFLEDAQREAERLSAAEAKAARCLREAGEALALGREAAARRMRELLSAPFDELGLGKEPLAIASRVLEFADWTSAGSTDVEFLLSANPGEPPRPLARIASGGELSRLMLGLKSVAPGHLMAPTLVFDEIDSGLGGETAVRVGRRLKLLAQDRQVIVITHLHQIAALADGHFEARKVTRQGRRVPELRGLSESERGEALARLIAGADPGQGMQKAARTLLRKGRSD